MPELPEVETIKNELKPYIVGQVISNINVIRTGLVRQPASLEEFHSRITGQKVTGISRRGKYLILKLKSGDFLVIHLKIAGSLMVSTDSSPLQNNTVAVIYLSNGNRIYFRDPRGFGAMWLVKDPNTVTKKLGPEALGKDLTPEIFEERLKKRKSSIKAVLLDQSFVAGVGNMYADEALFEAKINPLRVASGLTDEEMERLYHAIQKVLRRGIANKGATIINYYRPGGEPGNAQTQFKVAHGRGKECPVCKTPIERIAIRNRGTYFCPKCQAGT